MARLPEVTIGSSAANRATPAASRSCFIPLEAEERTGTAEDLASELRLLSQAPNSTLLVAEAAGELIGYVQATGGRYRRSRATAEVVIGVVTAASGHGVGTALLRQLDRWAQAADLRRLELTVMAHNHAARRLYQRSGFIEGAPARVLGRRRLSCGRGLHDQARASTEREPRTIAPAGPNRGDVTRPGSLHAKRVLREHDYALHHLTCAWHNVEVKPIRFTRSARKHRIGKAHALHVMNTAEPVNDPEGIGWIGPDDRGVELEIYLLERPDVFLVIHVMPTKLRRRQ